MSAFPFAAVMRFVVQLSPTSITFVGPFSTTLVGIVVLSFTSSIK